MNVQTARHSQNIEIATIGGSTTAALVWSADGTPMASCQPAHLDLLSILEILPTTADVAYVAPSIFTAGILCAVIIVGWAMGSRNLRRRRTW